MKLSNLSMLFLIGEQACFSKKGEIEFLRKGNIVANCLDYRGKHYTTRKRKPLRYYWLKVKGSAADNHEYVYHVMIYFKGNVSVQVFSLDWDNALALISNLEYKCGMPLAYEINVL